jgi:predicted RNA-binding protein YlxR (DUF448 family)
VGCRRRAPVPELVRVVRGEGGVLVPGAGLPGRGAWLCRGSEACFERAARRKAFERALRAPLHPGAVDGLRRELGLAPDVRGWMDTPAP